MALKIRLGELLAVTKRMKWDKAATRYRPLTARAGPSVPSCPTVPLGDPGAPRRPTPVSRPPIPRISAILAHWAISRSWHGTALPSMLMATIADRPRPGG